MKKIIIPLLLVLLAIIIFWCVSSHRPVIEATVAEQVEAGFANDAQASRFANVDVQGDFRNVVLSGTVASEAAKADAERIALNADIVKAGPASWVDNNIVVEAKQIAPALPPAPANYETSFQYSGQQVIASGLVPNENARAMILDKLRTRFASKNVQVIDRLKVESRGVPETWAASSDAIIARISQFDSGTAIIRNKDVSVRGELASAELKTKLESEFNQSLASRTNLSLNLNAKAPIVEEKAAAINCQKEFNEILTHGTILFNTDSDVIKPASYPLLQELADEFEKCPNASVDVIGHTDSVGDAGYNQGLSQRRAASVTRYLSSKGVNVSRITSIGKGEASPIASNDTKEGRAKNRRIEFKVKGV